MPAQYCWCFRLEMLPYQRTVRAAVCAQRGRVVRISWQSVVPPAECSRLQVVRLVTMWLKDPWHGDVVAGTSAPTPATAVAFWLLLVALDPPMRLEISRPSTVAFGSDLACPPSLPRAARQAAGSRFIVLNSDSLRLRS